MNTNRKPTLARVALAAWWTAMAIGTHWPNLSAQLKSLGIDEGATPFMMLDKWLHISAYLGLIWLALTARLTARAWTTVAIIVTYSCLDELTQGMVTGRSSSGMDLLASNFGVVLGTLTWCITRWLNDHDESFVAHGRVVAVLTLISRCFGLVRDWALAFAFGLSPVMDAFAIAFLIPNLFRRLFGEGALTAAFLPQYTRLRNHAEHNATHFARQTLLRLGLGLGVLALLGSLIAWGLVQTGTLDERGTLTAALTALLIWFAPMICATAIAGAVLQARGRFGPPAAAPVIMNIAIIGAALITWRTIPEDLTGQRRVFWVALAVIGAGVVQLFWHLNLMPAAEKPADQTALAEAGRRTIRKWLPTIFGLAVFQLNVLADAMIALFFSTQNGEPLSLFGWTFTAPMIAGDVAVLSFAQRLYEFPLGVFGIALATAIFPALAAAANDGPRYTTLLRQGLRLSMFIGLPASVGLILVREPLAAVIFSSAGNLETDAAARIAVVLCGYAPAVWAYSLNQTLTRAFYAKEDTITPVRISMGMVALNVAMNLTLIWWIGAAGLALSTSICAILQCALLTRLIRRHAPSADDAGVMRGWCRTAALTMAMAIPVAALTHPWSSVGATRGEAFGMLMMAVGLGAVIFGGGAMLWRTEELRWLWRGSG